MKLTDEKIVEALKAFEIKKPTFDAERELASMKKLDDNVEVSKFLEEYSLDHFVDAGGSGMIFCVRYNRHSTLRALKVPRAHTLEDDQNIPKEDPEVEALTKLSHEGITRLYGNVQIKPGRHVLISEWVGNAKDLDKYIKSQCVEIESTAALHEIESLLAKMAQLLYQVCKALKYMHDDATLYHFDIKPGNLLIQSSTNHLKAFVIDLGLARDMAKHKSGETLEVGFTYRYAHPELTGKNMLIKETQAKSSSRLKSEDLSPRYDLHAFGKTLQECLKEILKHFGEKARSSYYFDFMHLLSCLCLDGTGQVRMSRPDDNFVEDNPNNMPLDLFARHKFISFAQIEQAFERLLGHYRIETDIPELDPWYASTINASDITFVNLTPRVRRIIVHPFFKRLEDESQLGMLQEVFPTATHSRGNHSLGVYAAAGKYISALYWDADNPTCRLLITPKKVRALLLSALIHDLGQTAFGHDVEEINDKLFSHTEFTKRLIEESRNNEKIFGDSIEKIATEPEPNGWGLDSINDVINILEDKGPLPVDHLLHEIIDSSIDGDKLDYLIRDSVDCRVSYGHGIDVDRFLRSLTSIATEEDGENGPAKLELAAKAKGKASIDAFILARTQMYQALYWHHTFRAIKGMFLGAAAYTICHLEEGIQKEMQSSKISPKKFKEHFEQLLTDAYFNFIYLEPLGVSLADTKLISDNLFIKQLNSNKASPLKTLSGSTADRTLDFFYRLGPQNAREILTDLSQRHFYKRLFETPFITLKAPSKLQERLKDADARRILMDELEIKFKDKLSVALKNASQVQESMQADGGDSLLKSSWIDGATIVVDAPFRAVDKIVPSPKIVSDYKRKYHHGGRETAERTDSTLWDSHIETIMKESAYFRIFIRASVHDLIQRFMTPTEVRAAVKEIISLK